MTHPIWIGASKQGATLQEHRAALQTEIDLVDEELRNSIPEHVTLKLNYLIDHEHKHPAYGARILAICNHWGI